MEELHVVNEWSAGLNPTVFHKAIQVNSEDAVEGVGEGTGGDGKAQVDEDEHRRYGYKDPVIELLHRSYMHIWGTKGEHIGWRMCCRHIKSDPRSQTCMLHTRPSFCLL